MHFARERGTTLAKIPVEVARTVSPAFEADVLAVLDPKHAVAAKKSVGGTAPERVAEQIAWIRAARIELAQKAAGIPELAALAKNIEAAPI